MNIVNQMDLSFPAKSTNESFARSAVASFILQLDPTINELADIKTAVSEAVTNCIVHGYGYGDGTVYINVKITDKGKVIIEGIPRDVFSEVETMKKIGLDVPQVTEICYELKKAGINIDTKILNVNEMVSALCQLR